MLGIFSGNYLLGICGTETELYDYKNEKLFIGDIVLVQYNEYNLGSHSAYMSVIVGDKYETYTDSTIIEKDMSNDFVMGIKESSVTKKDLAHENEEGELMSGWVIEKIKSYEDVIDGEHWKDFGFNYKNIDIGKIKKGKS